MFLYFERFSLLVNKMDEEKDVDKWKALRFFKKNGILHLFKKCYSEMGDGQIVNF